VSLTPREFGQLAYSLLAVLEGNGLREITYIHALNLVSGFTEPSPKIIIKGGVVSWAFPAEEKP
jgi:hypothetical protein